MASEFLSKLLHVFIYETEKKNVTSRCWWTTIIYCLALLLLTCFHWYILNFLILLIPKNCTRTTAGMRNKQTCTKRENQWWTPQKKCKWQGFFCMCVIMLVFIRLLIITSVWLVTKLESQNASAWMKYCIHEIYMNGKHTIMTVKDECGEVPTALCLLKKDVLDLK